VTTPALVSILLGCSLFLGSVGAVTCLCYTRRRRRRDHRKVGGPLPLHKKPTAVRSPANTGHYLKKSPSPTGPTPSVTPPANKSHRPPIATPIDIQSLSNYSNKIYCLSVSKSLRPTSSRYNLIMSRVHTENEVKDKVALPTLKDEVEAIDKMTVTDSNSPPPSAKLGQLIFKLRYKKDKSTLIVSVVKCRDLPAKDPNVGSSDPYVKLQLLPEKQHKVKTRVLRKTRNPIYDEDFTFYGINTNQLQNITLHFVVLSFDRYSRDDIIGEVFCSLGTVDMSQADNQQLTLTRDIQPRSLKIKSQGRGELLVSLCWQPVANRLTVVVLKARNLPKMDVTGLADPYVKMYLLYNGQRIAKKKTHVKKRTLNPVFNESFVFEIPAGAEALNKINLEFLLLDWDRVTKNEVIGRLELGGSKNTGSALHHWTEVTNSPRRQIAEWHKLRE
ncbi:hypothetical protein AAG570_006988, partial [Ranatra chinensis]